MKTRPVVIHVPVVRLPTLAQVWGVAWRLLVLLVITVCGYAVAAIWPEQQLFCMFLAGAAFAHAQRAIGWSK